MTLRTDPLSPREIEDTFADALNLLRSVRRTLARLLEQAEEGDGSVLKDVTVKTAELESALKRAFEAQDRYNAWAEKTSGVRTACETDFAALRDEIACRLARLRDCCEEG